MRHVVATKHDRLQRADYDGGLTDFEATFTSRTPTTRLERPYPFGRGANRPRILFSYAVKIHVPVELRRVRWDSSSNIQPMRWGMNIRSFDFTLVVRRDGEAWRIIHPHGSNIR